MKRPVAETPARANEWLGPADDRLTLRFVATLPIVVLVNTLVGSIVGVSERRNMGANGAPSKANKWSLSLPWGSWKMRHDLNRVVWLNCRRIFDSAAQGS